MKYTDKEIIEAIKKGNADEVLNFLYQTVQFKIKNWILKNNGSEEEAQDIFQDAVLSFYNYVLAGKFNEGKSVEGFVFTIGRNLWVNRAKQKQKIVTVTEEQEYKLDIADENDFLKQSIDEEKAKKIEALLNQLGERCKELLTYSIFYGLSMVEISEKMGFSNANAAKTKNYKCKQRLIKIIDNNDNVKSWLY